MSTRLEELQKSLDRITQETLAKVWNPEYQQRQPETRDKVASALQKLTSEGEPGQHFTTHDVHSMLSPGDASLGEVRNHLEDMANERAIKRQDPSPGAVNLPGYRTRGQDEQD